MKIEDLIPSVLKNENRENVTTLPDYLLDDTMVVGYPDSEMQEEIYEYAVQSVLPGVLDPINPIDIVDIGAGRGDLRAFLDKRYNGISGFEYHGFELNSIHRNIAKVKYNIELYPNDFLSYVMNFSGWGFCIGSLNDDYGLFPSNSIVDKFNYFKKLLNHSLEKISHGVVFILLNETPEEQENLIPFPIPEMMRFLDDEFRDLSFNLDYSKFQGIYRLVIYNQRLTP